MYDDYDSICGEENGIDDDTESMPGSLEENNGDKLYIWLSDTTNGEKYLVEGNNFFSRRMDEKGGLFRVK